MARKMLLSARVALVSVVALGATGTAIAGAGAAAQFYVCYDRATRVMHLSPTGRCNVASQISLKVDGAGEQGATGAQGVQGPTGGTGGTGAHGAVGGSGIQGIQGIQGVQGPGGGTGTAGTNGGTGTAGTNGGTGGTGTIGGTGPAGTNSVNAFQKITNTDTAATGPVTATCAAGGVVTGGGFIVPSPTYVLSSTPNGAGTAWVVNYSGGPGTAITAYAICVTGTSS
ncbi:MAG: hypothetical protein ACLPVY_16195 [Acidimicrobiia bacterium]